jgi:ADP-heptose:LPS heptosyltransferase
MPNRVVILRALALGDLLCAVPALRAFRRAWPQAEISLVALPWAREFVARFSAYIDRFIEFPGWPGLPEREPLIDRIPGFLAEMQRERFDLAIQLQGSGTIVNSLIALFGATRVAGFFPAGYYRPDAEMFAPWPEEGLEIHRLLSLVAFLGLPSAGDPLEFPLEAIDFAQLDQLLPARFDDDHLLVIVHPGSSVRERRWPAERFAAVGDALHERGFRIVITGVESERPVVNGVAAAMHHPVINLCGATDLGTLGALVSRAALVICNDTGISHVAAALRTPSVVISTGDNPARWAPIDRRLHRVLCQPDGVSTGAALAAACDLLAEPSTLQRIRQHAQLVTT